MTTRPLIFAACVLFTSIGCGGRRGFTIAPDVDVRFAGQERSPRLDPSARLAAAAAEVRDLLGHALTVEFDAALAPRDEDELDATLIPLFETLAEGLVTWREKDLPTFTTAQQHLAHIIVRYAPDSTDNEPTIRLEGSGTVVVSCAVPEDESLLGNEILALLERTSETTRLAGPAPAPSPHISSTPSTAATDAGKKLSRTDVYVLWGTKRKRREDSPEQVRVSQVAAKIERYLGHALTIEVDLALVPKSHPKFLAHSAAALDSLVSYLARAAKNDPLLYAFVRRKLKRLTVRYTASSAAGTTTFDDTTGSLIYTIREYSEWMPDLWRTETVPEFHYPFDDEPRAPHSLPDTHTYLVASPDDVFIPAFNRELHTRFGSVDDSRLTAGDYTLRRRYLHTRFAEMDEHKLTTDDYTLYRSYLETLRETDRGEAMLRFEPHTRGAAIHDEVEKATVDMAMAIFVYPRKAEHAKLLRACTAWVADRFFELAHSNQRALRDVLFRECETPCIEFPEPEQINLALAVLERKLLASEEAEPNSTPSCGRLRDGHMLTSTDCARIYRFLTASTDRAERLVTVLIRTARRDLLLAALLNIAGDQHTRNVVHLFAALDAKGGPLYADAFRISIDPNHGIFDRLKLTLLSEAKSRWADRADLRPVFLGLLAEDCVSKRCGIAELEAQLSHLAGLDAALFASFLDEGPRSVELALGLLPVLTDVPMPFELVASRLDAYLASKPVQGAHTVTGLVRLACKTRDTEGLRVIRMVLEKRARGGDGGAATLVRETRFCVSGVVSG